MSRPSPPVILVTDDHEDTRDIYSLSLGQLGYTVHTAANCDEALKKAREIRPALIVMDLGMPQLDGLEATRRLKADPELRTIPILVVTAHALDTIRIEAMKAGADAHLTKPCEPDDVAAAISKLLSGRSPR